MAGAMPSLDCTQSLQRRYQLPLIGLELFDIRTSLSVYPLQLLCRTASRRP